ncbi:hypothetical protein HK101_002147 [Irineochytrium annulatum]|nr:hypothetical protein HK101_002147 [Irineochytrium annulatum]
MQYAVHTRTLPWQFDAFVNWMVILACCLLLFSSSLYLFWARRRTRCIEARAAILTICQSCSGLILGFVVVEYRIFPDMPCFLPSEFSNWGAGLTFGEVWITGLSACTWASCVCLRSVYLYIKYRFNQGRLFGTIAAFNTSTGLPLNMDPNFSSTSHRASSIDSCAASSFTNASLIYGATPASINAAQPQANVTTSPSMRGLGSIHEDTVGLRRSMTVGAATSVGDWEGAEDSENGPTRVGSSRRRYTAASVKEVAAIVKARAKSWTKSLDGYVDRWLGRRGRCVSEKPLLIAVAAVNGVYVVYASVVEVFTTKYRIYPVMDINLCTFGVMEYGFTYLMLILVLVIVNPLIFWVLSGVKESHFMAADLIVTGVLGTAVIVMYYFFSEFDASDFIPISFIVCIQIASVVVPVVKSYWDEYRYKSVTLRLNMESLEKVVADEDLFQSLKEFTAADLSVENALFLEAYQVLVKKTNRYSARLKATERRKSGGVHLMSPSTVSYLATLEASRSDVPLANSITMTTTDQNIDETSGSLTSTSPTSPASPGSPVSPVSPAPSTVPLHPSATPSTRNLTRLPRSPSAPSSHPNSTPTTHITPAPAHVSLSTTPHYVPVEMRKRYTAFYYLYIAPGATHEVNIPYPIRAKLRDRLAGQDWRVGDFDEARQQVMALIFYDIYPRWMVKRAREAEGKKGRSVGRGESSMLEEGLEETGSKKG